MGRPAIDITGQTFERLKVIKRDSALYNDGDARWVCLCDPDNGGCGGITVVAGTKLRRKEVKSCGCLVKEKATTHGLSNTPEYNIWRHVKDRCRNESNNNYHRYGGRGITMSDDWYDNFETFYNDMGPRPGPGYSIERIENDKGYYKGNCKWATKEEQANNRRTNVFYTHNGVSKTLAAWCKELNLDYALVNYRLNNYGWTFEEAIRPKLR